MNLKNYIDDFILTFFKRLCVYYHFFLVVDRKEWNGITIPSQTVEQLGLSWN